MSQFLLYICGEYIYTYPNVVSDGLLMAPCVLLRGVGHLQLLCPISYLLLEG